MFVRPGVAAGGALDFPKLVAKRASHGLGYGMNEKLIIG